MKINETNCNSKEPNYITDSISILGPGKALTICMEECSELIQAISKLIRNKEGSLHSVVEEVADVLICIDWIQEILGLDDHMLDKVKDRKIRRLQSRIESDTLS